MSAALSVFKLSVQSVCQLQQHTISLFRNDRIALSVNSCGKSFHIDSKEVFSSAMLVGFVVCSAPVSHPIHDNSMATGDLNISKLKVRITFLIFECNQILQWNLQNICGLNPPLSSLSIWLKFQRYWIFPKAHPVRLTMLWSLLAVLFSIYKFQMLMSGGAI